MTQALDPTGPTGPSPTPDVWGTARSPRMLALLVLFLAVAAVCARLGVWQLDRAQQSGEQQARLQAEAQAAGGPQDLVDVLRPQEGFRGGLIGTVVRTEGRFEGDPLLVPGRPDDGRIGYAVVQALRVPVDATEAVPQAVDDQADQDGAVLVVVRGWVPDETAPVPPPPSGPVEVVGVLQAGEGAGPAGLPVGQVGAISPAQLVNVWGGPMWSAYLVLTEPPGGTVPPGDGGPLELYEVPAPSAGLDLQNLAYALQWWIFGGFAVLLWWRLVRDEARAAVEEGEDDASTADTAAPSAHTSMPPG